jgi:hypothetical protein
MNVESEPKFESEEQNLIVDEVFATGLDLIDEETFLRELARAREQYEALTKNN